jgi:hypothetical protein
MSTASGTPKGSARSYFSDPSPAASQSIYRLLDASHRESDGSRFGRPGSS